MQSPGHRPGATIQSCIPVLRSVPSSDCCLIVPYRSNETNQLLLLRPPCHATRPGRFHQGPTSRSTRFERGCAGLLAGACLTQGDTIPRDSKRCVNAHDSLNQCARELRRHNVGILSKRLSLRLDFPRDGRPPSRSSLDHAGSDPPQWGLRG